jgi:hypothetical protein
MQREYRDSCRNSQVDCLSRGPFPFLGTVRFCVVKRSAIPAIHLSEKNSGVESNREQLPGSLPFKDAYDTRKVVRPDLGSRFGN